MFMISAIMSVIVKNWFAWLLLLLTEPVCGAHVPGIAVNDTLNLAFLAPWSHDWVLAPGAASGFSLALEEVNNRQILPGYTIEWKFRDTYCKPQQGWLHVLSTQIGPHRDRIQPIETNINSVLTNACLPNGIDVLRLRYASPSPPTPQ